MNKPTLYLLATLTTAASCVNHKPTNIVTTKNKAGEDITIRLDVENASVLSDKGPITIPNIKDSTLTITNLDKDTKLIYVNSANKSVHLVDEITAYKTTGGNRQAIVRSTYNSFVRGQNLELTDSLFTAADNDWREKTRYLNEIRRKTEQKEQSRLQAKKNNEYNKLKNSVYKTIDAIKK